MFFLGIFSPFFQSHSSLCSFKKTKIFSKKNHKSFAKQFIEIPFIFSSAVSFLVIPFAEVELCQLIALDLAMRL